MFRAARPLDIPGLVYFAARTVPDLAYPRRRLGGAGSPAWALGALASPWLPHRGALHTLVLARGRGVNGLVALRGQRDLAAWEVDHLLLSSSSTDACADLLAWLDALLVQAQGERIFLRLAAESPILDAACQAGYRPYLMERLYHLSVSRSARRLPPPESGLQVRTRRPEDDYPLFRLYGAATPVSVRTAEGLTFREWQEASIVRWQESPQARDQVVLREGQPVAWARVAAAAAGQTRVIALLADPRDQQAAATALRAALDALGPRAACPLLGEHAPAFVGGLLEEAGFVPGRSYISLVHHVGARLMEPAFMPAGV